MKHLFALCLFFSMSTVFCAEKPLITCSHLQVCNLVDHQLRGLDGIQVKRTHMPLAYLGDPHHFEPTTAQVRALLTAELLITGPQELHPWIRPILIQRQKNSALKTFELQITESQKQRYPGASLEALSHFWLYPEISCQMQQALSETLKLWGENPQSSKNCPNSLVNFTQKKTFSQLKGQTVVVTHDAFAPALTEHGVKVITLRGSHHGERLTSQTLKDLHDELKNNPAVIWLFEEPLENSDQIEKLIRNQDLQLRVNTLGLDQEGPFDTYLRILRALSKVIQWAI